MYEARWTGLSTPSWDRETNLQLSRRHVLRYWVGTPNQHQHRQTGRLYRRMRNGSAQREFFSEQRRAFPGNGPRLRHTHRLASPLPHHGHTHSRLCPFGVCLSTSSGVQISSGAIAHFWHKGDDVLWRLGNISVRTTADYGWGILVCGFWMTRDRPYFLFLRRATIL